MKHHHTIGKMLSVGMVLVVLMAVTSSSRSQGLTTTHTITKVTPTIFYIKIGGLMGPAKGYFNKSIAYHGYNSTVNLPDRLKAGTYNIQFVDASGRSVPMASGTSVLITSKPQNAATNTTSGKRQHQPITITKEIDKASPLSFTIAAGDVDEDGMLDVMMAVKTQGASNPPPAKN
jgi:Type VI secretion system effector, Hcp